MPNSEITIGQLRFFLKIYFQKQISFLVITFMTGTDSPVNMDSSTIQGPLNSNRSHGTSFSSWERPSSIHNTESTQYSTRPDIMTACWMVHLSIIYGCSALKEAIQCRIRLLSIIETYPCYHIYTK